MAVVALYAGIGGRVDEVRDDVRELRADVRSMDARLRAVEVAFGKVDQRLATLERLHLPSASDR